MGVVTVVTKTEHETTPLVVRASLPRTFLGLGAFVEAGLLFCGAYLLINAIASPLEANQTAVLAAAATLALALILLFYLAQPMRRQALARSRENRRAGNRAKRPEVTLTNFGTAIQTRMNAAHALEHKRNLPVPM
jgi:hypothetical protein